jgi:hypothetical protein
MTWYGIERLVSEQISTLAKITGVHMKPAVVWRDRDSFVDFSRCNDFALDDMHHRGMGLGGILPACRRLQGDEDTLK